MAAVCAPVNVVSATAVADDSLVWLRVGLLGGAATVVGCGTAGAVLVVDGGKFHVHVQAQEQLHAWLYVHVVVVPSGCVNVHVHVHRPL
jgi:hypothetical protein